MQKLDSLDLSILDILQEDARLPTREIGFKLNKSHSSIQSRIQRLRDEGFIKKYTVVLDYDKLDFGFMTFTSIQLKDHSEDLLNSFEREIVKIPEVMECHYMTGDYDFMLKIVAKDQHEYHEVLMKKLFATIGVGRVQTKLVMKTSKSDARLPIKSGR